MMERAYAIALSATDSSGITVASASRIVGMVGTVERFGNHSALQSDVLRIARREGFVSSP